jgi:nucleoid-associated protein YejK
LPEDLIDLTDTILHRHQEREKAEDELEDELVTDLEDAVEELDEVYSQKQRRWACAQKDKPAKKRKKGLSKKEADEMCKSKELKKKKPKRGKK